mmetsp:Transcript_49164/g.111512  ORF Transcript_49164/g.111512 Transcript_49164/m.111512 type:complete len:340 (+) Transcript_49164:1200-2219(+)
MFSGSPRSRRLRTDSSRRSSATLAPARSRRLCSSSLSLSPGASGQSRNFLPRSLRSASAIGDTTARSNTDDLPGGTWDGIALSTATRPCTRTSTLPSMRVATSAGRTSKPATNFSAPTPEAAAAAVAPAPSPMLLSVNPLPSGVPSGVAWSWDASLPSALPSALLPVSLAWSSSSGICWPSRVQRKPTEDQSPNASTWITTKGLSTSDRGGLKPRSRGLSNLATPRSACTKPSAFSRSRMRGTSRVFGSSQSSIDTASLKPKRYTGYSSDCLLILVAEPRTRRTALAKVITTAALATAKQASIPARKGRAASSAVPTASCAAPEAMEPSAEQRTVSRPR